MKKKALFILIPFLTCASAIAQSRFINDTLYTSCGYKIYKGQTLKFGKAKAWNGFLSIDIRNGLLISTLENKTAVVKDLSRYNESKPNNPQIRIKGSIVYKDGTTGELIIDMHFDEAIGRRLPGIAAELIVPEEFLITKEQAAMLHMPAFEADTLLTSCGYKIYTGQTILFGKPTGNRRFRYVNIRNGVPPSQLQNNHVMIKELKEFGISGLGNAYITIIGTIVENNKDIEVHMAFDHAIENIPGVPSELIVPDEFRNKLKIDLQKELARLVDLLQNGTLTEEEFESIKKKLQKQ